MRTNHKLISSIYKKRDPFSHKGDYGHCLIIAGSYGMMGAAILAVQACLRSGAGKVTALVPECGYAIIQSAAPEAMAITSGTKFIKAVDENFSIYTTIGVGPGIGKHSSHKKSLQHLFTCFTKPIVIDADALNQIAASPELLYLIPAQSILTPHPKEFERLFGTSDSQEALHRKALDMAAKYKVIIVLKGHETFIACPDGASYTNTTGNAGMAKGGSGDVLTGLLTGLLSSGYDPEKSAVLGVFLHGLAGDLASKNRSEEAMTAVDIIDHLGKAFRNIS